MIGVDLSYKGELIIYWINHQYGNPKALEKIVGRNFQVLAHQTSIHFYLVRTDGHRPICLEFV